jgi:hypothetical protein
MSSKAAETMMEKLVLLQLDCGSVSESICCVDMETNNAKKSWTPVSPFDTKLGKSYATIAARL